MPLAVRIADNSRARRPLAASKNPATYSLLRHYRTALHQLVGNVLRNQFSVTCVQKREVSLWIIFQVWMHVPATCEECNFFSKTTCYVKQYLLNPKLSHLIHFHFFSNRNKQSERLKKYQLIKISIRLERKSEKVVNMYRLIISSIDKIIN